MKNALKYGKFSFRPRCVQYKRVKMNIAANIIPGQVAGIHRCGSLFNIKPSGTVANNNNSLSLFPFLASFFTPTQLINQRILCLFTFFLIFPTPSL